MHDPEPPLRQRVAEVAAELPPPPRSALGAAHPQLVLEWLGRDGDFTVRTRAQVLAARGARPATASSDDG